MFTFNSGWIKRKPRRFRRRSGKAAFPVKRIFGISDEQMSYVTNADAGCGLIKYGSALVPFINRFPKDTELYRLMTTRPGEGVFGSGNAS